MYLPWMAAVVLRPVERGMPCRMPRTAQGVVVRPCPERIPGRAVPRSAIDAKELPGPPAERDRVEVPIVSADRAGEPPVEIAPWMGGPERVPRHANGIPRAVLPNRLTVSTTAARHGSRGRGLRLLYASVQPEGPAAGLAGAHLPLDAPGASVRSRPSDSVRTSRCSLRTAERGPASGCAGPRIRPWWHLGWGRPKCTPARDTASGPFSV